MKRFTQRIYKIGINPVVDPPDEVLNAVFEQAGRSRGPIPVCGTLNGAAFVQTLVKYKGAWRLYINGSMLKAASLTVGNLAEVEIEYDRCPREVAMPEQFTKALNDDPTALLEYEKLSPSRKKEILRYLGSLKTNETLTRNINRVIGHLSGAEQPTLNALMRKKK